jgi:pyruvate dehydrogenase kinase 2/3/4
LSLDKFYTSRINVRMLAQQHIEMFGKQKQQQKASMIGMIDPHCKPAAIAHDAALSAKILCESIYGIVPKVEIDLPTGDVEFSYIPAHLYHILFELLKNSMRATIEAHGTGKMPPVRVIIVEGKEDLTIKVSDEGGGIKRSGMPFIFSYLYSTAQLPSDLSLDSSNRYSSGQVPMAGFGFGLSLSRVFARYFGGDLQVISTERFGTDAYVYLKRVAAEAGEVIPKYML